MEVLFESRTDILAVTGRLYFEQVKPTVSGHPLLDQANHEATTIGKPIRFPDRFTEKAGFR